ncbi:hypothetical protein RGI86_002248 [Morganella morganii]|nr:hypothetical protein [Morganella morganii]
MVKKLLLALLSVGCTFSSMASSTICASMAADAYYTNLLGNDKVLTAIRSNNPNQLSMIEIRVINNLIYSCEKGITDKSINVNELWKSVYDDAVNTGTLDKESAKAYATEFTNMYELGKTITN